MTIYSPFAATFGSGVVVASVTTTSASSALGLGNKAICVTNTGATNPIFVRTGLSSVTATTADYCVMPNNQVFISKPQDHTHIAYVTGTSTSTAHIIAGEGGY
jgi:hypothetical protein